MIKRFNHIILLIYKVNFLFKLSLLCYLWKVLIVTESYFFTEDPSPNSRRRRHRSPSHSDVTSMKSPASQRKSKSPPKQMRLSRGSKKEGGKIAAEEEKFGVLKAIQEKIRNSQFDDDDQCDVIFKPVTSSTMIKNDGASSS